MASMTRKAAALATAAVLALAAAGCGGGDSTPSADPATAKWADSVCGAGADLKTAAANFVAAVKSPNIADLGGYKAKVAEKYAALKTAVEAADAQWSAAATINGDTSAGQQLVRKDMQAVYDAWSLVDGAYTKLTKASTVSAAVAASADLASGLAQSVGAAGRLAQTYESWTKSTNNQLKLAFTNSAECKALFGKK